MSHQTTDMLMVFCEGAHDVEYVHQVIKHCFGFNKVTWQFKDYPAPLDELFPNTIKTHAAGDLSLDMAHKFFLPNEILAKDNKSILLFNSGGATKFNDIKEFLSKFLDLLNRKTDFASGKVIGSLNYLFLYDADSHGATEVQDTAISNLKTITYFDQEIDADVDWEAGEWVIDEQNPFAASNGIDKAVYIWGQTPEKGTLEDLLYLLFQKDNSDLFAKTQSFVDEVFTWQTNQPKLVQAIAEEAKRSKAIFTIMGQRKNPGSSMSVMLKKEVPKEALIAADTWKQDEHVLRFARFVSKFAKLEFEECSPNSAP